MTDDRKHAARKSTSFRNPLDWPHIDRMILLAMLTLLSPLVLGMTLFVSWRVAPDFFVPEVAQALLAMYAAAAVLMLMMIAAAVRRRRGQREWPLFEIAIDVIYIVMTFSASWAAGTIFTLGLLLMILGTSMNLTLASAGIMQRVFVGYSAGFVLAAIAQLSGHFTFAPLFSLPPYNLDGSPMLPWMVLHIVLGLSALLMMYISVIASERWMHREQRLRELSTIDGLTRVSNRRRLVERGHSEIKRTARQEGAGFSCILIDVDFFKKVNDTWGHAAGDAVLVQVAALLKHSARAGDEVGRYGGEEFLVLLPGASRAAAMEIAERLRARIEAMRIDVDAGTLKITASFGVAHAGARTTLSFAELLKDADAALYAAKHAGRNRVVAHGAD